VGRRRAWVVAGRLLDTKEGLLVTSPPPSFTRECSPPGAFVSSRVVVTSRYIT
jgi:hypothetical protein